MKLKRRFWWVNPEMLSGFGNATIWPIQTNHTQSRVEVRLAPKAKRPVLPCICPVPPAKRGEEMSQTPLADAARDQLTRLGWGGATRYTDAKTIELRLNAIVAERDRLEKQLLALYRARGNWRAQKKKLLARIAKLTASK
jgi:hypothetical protein